VSVLRGRVSSSRRLICVFTQLGPTAAVRRGGVRVTLNSLASVYARNLPSLLLP